MVPPDAVIVPEYKAPTVAPGSAEVVIVNLLDEPECEEFTV
jgi:hypothetical protein